MDFVRKVTNSYALKHIVDLPESLQNQEVEIIILPVNNDSPLKRILPPSSSARGSLRQYANKDLLQTEQDAWEKGVRDKHEHR